MKSITSTLLVSRRACWTRIAGRGLHTSFLFLELFADRLQFLSVLGARFWVGHLEFFEGIEKDLGHDQPRVLLVVGGNDIPRRVVSGCCAEALFICLHVILP